MVLDSYRSDSKRFLTPAGKAFAGAGISANSLTYTSLLLAVLAAYLIYSGVLLYLPFASILILISSLLDALDGEVARITGTASKRGDFLDHAIDRYADLILLLGIMFSPYAGLEMGVFAVSGVMLTSYMGTQAQALGCGRNYRGVLGRADRLVLLILAPLIQYPFGHGPVYELTAFQFLLLWFAIAGHATAVQRGVQIWGELGK